MADEQVTEKASKKATSTSRFREAVDWAVDQFMKHHGKNCGICSFRPWDWGSDAQIAAALSAHVRRKHHDTILDCFDNDTLDLSTQKAPLSGAEDELLSVSGINEVRQLDRMDLLEIPPAIRKQAELDGAEFYWKRQEEVEHLKSQGAELVYTNGDIGAHQHSTENGVLRTRELVCMRLPHELVVQRRKQKANRITDQLNARAEEIRVKRDAYEKRTYDYLRQERNLDHEQAERISRAMVNRRVRESGVGMTVTDRRGTSTY